MTKITDPDDNFFLNIKLSPHRMFKHLNCEILQRSYDEKIILHNNKIIVHTILFTDNVDCFVLMVDNGFDLNNLKYILDEYLSCATVSFKIINYILDTCTDKNFVQYILTSILQKLTNSNIKLFLSNVQEATHTTKNIYIQILTSAINVLNDRDIKLILTHINYFVNIDDFNEICLTAMVENVNNIRIQIIIDSVKLGFNILPHVKHIYDLTKQCNNKAVRCYLLLSYVIN